MSLGAVTRDSAAFARPVQALSDPGPLPACGSLRGKLIMAPDRDSPEVNDAIADDFGSTR
jgi:hypothetical protein